MLTDRSLGFLRPFLASQNLGLGGVPTHEAWWTRVFTAGPFPIDPPAALLAPGSGWAFPSSEQIVGVGAVGARAGILGWWLVAPGCLVVVLVHFTPCACCFVAWTVNDWGLSPLLILKRLTTTISAWILSLDHHPPSFCSELWVFPPTERPEVGQVWSASGASVCHCSNLVPSRTWPWFTYHFVAWLESEERCDDHKEQFLSQKVGMMMPRWRTRTKSSIFFWMRCS